MDLTPYVDTLRKELLGAALVADENLHEAVEKALRQLDPIARLVFMSLLADADAEITRLLQESGVNANVQAVIKGRNPEHQVRVETPSFAPDCALIEQQEDLSTADSDDGETVRITLRLPAKIKAKADVMAGDRSMSLNAWIVDAVREANKGVSHDIREFQQVMSTLASTWKSGRAGKTAKSDNSSVGGWEDALPDIPPLPRNTRAGKNIDSWI